MFNVRIVNSGAAFEKPREEISRILRELADRIENGENPQIIRDVNGNRCGLVTTKKFSQ